MQVTQSKYDALHFNFSSGTAVYLQLAEKLELLIVSGAFAQGERLPSVRELSLFARVNPNTLQKSLALLEEERLIRTDRTNGKYVTEDAELLELKRRSLAQKTVDAFLLQMEQIGFGKSETLKILNKGFNHETNSSSLD